MMDAQSKAMLDEILAQEPAALTDADKAFLRARCSYLSEEQKAVYAEALADQTEIDEPTPEEPEAAEQPQARKGRKVSEASQV